MAVISQGRAVVRRLTAGAGSNSNDVPPYAPDGVEIATGPLVRALAAPQIVTAADPSAVQRAAELGPAQAVLGWRQPDCRQFERFARIMITERTRRCSADPETRRLTPVLTLRAERDCTIPLRGDRGDRVLALSNGCRYRRAFSSARRMAGRITPDDWRDARTSTAQAARARHPATLSHGARPQQHPRQGPTTRGGRSAERADRRPGSDHPRHPHGDLPPASRTRQPTPPAAH